MHKVSPYVTHRKQYVNRVMPCPESQQYLYVCMYFESNCWLILQLNLTLGQCLSLCQLRWREHAETAASKCGALILLRQKVDEVKN